MTVTALIPARGGSKGVPGKNLRMVGSMSLLARAIRAAERSGEVDHVLVSTDDAKIAAEAERAGAEVVERPADLASDTASSEAALLHAAEERPDVLGGRDDVMVFIQCTSPFIDPDVLGAAVRRARSGEADVVFSVVDSHGFVWMDTGNGARGINHDHRERLRRQDRHAEYLETGAFYVMRAAGFVEARHRFFGSIAMERVDPRHAVEIDTFEDLDLATRLAPLVDPFGVTGLDPDRIDALVMDFDGVHTDNTAYVLDDGREAARVNRSDGMGVSMARRAGLQMLILSTETNPIVRRRAEKLRVECIAECDDKLPALREWADANGLVPEQIAYIGNDVNDRACLEWVGWPIIVADAHESLSGMHATITNACGGDGAVREVLDRLTRPRTSSPKDSGDPP